MDSGAGGASATGGLGSTAIGGARSSGGHVGSSGGSGELPAGGNASLGGMVGTGGVPQSEAFCLSDGVEIVGIESAGVEMAQAIVSVEDQLIIAGYYQGTDVGDEKTHHTALARFTRDGVALDELRANFGEYDEALGVAMHPTGSLFIAGLVVESSEIPPSRALVSRFAADGSAWATLETRPRSEMATAIAAAPFGATYVGGYSYGPLGTDDEPEAFLRRYLDSDSGTETYNIDVQGIGQLHAIATDSSARLYLAGSTLVDGERQALLWISNGASENFSEVLLGRDTEEATALVVAKDGFVLAGGRGRHGAFVKRLAPDGREIFTSWYAGARPETRGLAVDARGAVHLAGTIELESGQASFLAILSEEGVTLWHGLFEGTVRAIAADGACNIYLAGRFPTERGSSAVFRLSEPHR